MSARTAGLVFCGLIGAVILFQLALAVGAPWGRYAMGGAFPGAMPPAMRVAAVVQALVLALFGCVIAARAGLLRAGAPSAVRLGAWAVTGLVGVSLVLNLITPSAGERLIWAPIVLILLGCSLRVATSAAPPAR